MTRKLNRGNQTLDITISPVDGIIDIWVLADNSKVLEMNLENIEEMKIEMTRDKEILHVIFGDDDIIEKFFIETKPSIFVYCSKKYY